MRKLKVLEATGLMARLNEQGGLEVEGLKAIHPRGADELRRYVRENKAQIIAELQAQAPAVDHAQVAPRPPSPKTAAHELIDLAQDGRLDLAWTDSGPVWSIPLEHEQADRDWIGGLVQEAMLEPAYLQKRIAGLRA